MLERLLSLEVGGGVIVVSLKTSNGCTPLHLAAGAGHAAVCERLIRVRAGYICQCLRCLCYALTGTVSLAAWLYGALTAQVCTAVSLPGLPRSWIEKCTSVHRQ